MPISEIYRCSWINRKIFKTDYHVKTIEQVYGINKEFETCYLLSSPTIKAHKKQGHNFLHIGLVQVGVKPLIREGLNGSILMALRDTRHIRFNDSLLGTTETSLSGGPVHFNCFPNFTVHLHDPMSWKPLPWISRPMVPSWCREPVRLPWYTEFIASAWGQTSMSKPLTKGDREKLLSFKPQILDPTSRYPKPYNGQRLPS